MFFSDADIKLADCNNSLFADNPCWPASLQFPVYHRGTGNVFRELAASSKRKNILDQRKMKEWRTPHLCRGQKIFFLKQKLQWYLVTQNPGGLGHLPDPCYWNRIWPVSFWRSGGWAADNSNTFPFHMSFTQLMPDYPGLNKENNFCFWQRFFWQVISQT